MTGSELRSRLRRSDNMGAMDRLRRTPVTAGLIAIWLLGFLLASGGLRNLADPLLLREGSWSEPWRLLTYTLAPIHSGSGLFWLLLTCLWVYQFGMQLELQKGSRFVLVVLAGFSVGVGVFALLGAAVLQTPFALVGQMVAATGIAMTWGFLNPNSIINLFCVLPMKGLWFALLDAVLLFFMFTDFHPALALFSIPPMAALYYGTTKWNAYTKSDKAVRKRKEQEQRNFLDSVAERQKARDEREKLRKLFERSLIEDPEERKGP